MRRPTFFLTVAAAVLASTVVAPSTASAATGPVVSAVTTAPTDPGIVRVAATSDVGISSVSVTVTGPYVNLQTVATLTAFHRVSGTDLDGVWESDTRLVIASYGDYTLHATATDTAPSPEVTATDHYVPTAVVVSHTLGTLDLDWQHPALLASGQIDQVDPKTGDTTPGAGLEFDISSNHGSFTGTTKADGSYSGSMTPSHPTDGAVVQFAVHTGATVIDSGTYTEHVAQSRIVTQTATPKIRYGSPVTVTGDLQVLDGATWVPVTGALITLLDGGTFLDQGMVDAAGHISLSGTVYRTTTLHLQLDSVQRPPFVSDVTSDLPLTVLNGTKVVWFSPAINEFSELTLNGAIVSTDDFGITPGGGKVYIQRSSNGTTGWTTLAYFTPNSTGGFNLVDYLPNPSGWFRLYAVPGGDFLPSSSRAVKLSRIVTRVASPTAPTAVRKGAVASLHGVVQSRSGTTWKPIARAAVYVFFRAKGTTAFKQMMKVTTTSTGAFTAKVKPTRTGSWVAVWFTPNRLYLNAYSPLWSVTVR